MALCGQCSRAGLGVAGHCGWCTCCAGNRTGNIGGGRSPMAGNQRSGCGSLFLLMVVTLAALLSAVLG